VRMKSWLRLSSLESAVPV